MPKSASKTPRTEVLVTVSWLSGHSGQSYQPYSLLPLNPQSQVLASSPRAPHLTCASDLPATFATPAAPFTVRQVASTRFRLSRLSLSRLIVSSAPCRNLPLPPVLRNGAQLRPSLAATKAARAPSSILKKAPTSRRHRPRQRQRQRQRSTTSSAESIRTIRTSSSDVLCPC